MEKKLEIFNKYKQKFDELQLADYELIDVVREKYQSFLIVKHNTCDTTYRVNQYKFIKEGQRCPTCRSQRISKSKRKTISKLLEDIQRQVGNEYNVEGEYKGTHDDMIFTHITCGRKFNMSPNNFLSGQRCPHCALAYKANLYRKTQAQFEKEVEDAIGTDYVVSGQYINSHTKIQMYHKTCGKYFNVQPSKVLFNHQTCPYCVSATKGERAVIKFLDDNNIEYIFQVTRDGLLGDKGGHLSYDFYLPKYDMYIEYQGEFHAGIVSTQTPEDYERQLRYDNIKREYARNTNSGLLEIWYYDFENIDNILAETLLSVAATA